MYSVKTVPQHHWELTELLRGYLSIHVFKSVLYSITLCLNLLQTSILLSQLSWQLLLGHGELVNLSLSRMKKTGYFLVFIGCLHQLCLEFLHNPCMCILCLSHSHPLSLSLTQTHTHTHSLSSSCFCPPNWLAWATSALRSLTISVNLFLSLFDSSYSCASCWSFVLKQNKCQVIYTVVVY